MAFCTVAGIDIECIEGQSTRRDVLVGNVHRMFAGNLVSSIRAIKREAHVVSYNLTPAADAALRAATGNGATPVTWTGDIINGASVSALVEIVDMDFVNVGSTTTHGRRPTLIIREI